MGHSDTKSSRNITSTRCLTSVLLPCAKITHWIFDEMKSEKNTYTYLKIYDCWWRLRDGMGPVENQWIMVESGKTIWLVVHIPMTRRMMSFCADVFLSGLQSTFVALFSSETSSKKCLSHRRVRTGILRLYRSMLHIRARQSDKKRKGLDLVVSKLNRQRLDWWNWTHIHSMIDQLDDQLWKVKNKRNVDAPGKENVDRLLLSVHLLRLHSREDRDDSKDELNSTEHWYDPKRMIADSNHRPRTTTKVTMPSHWLTSDDLL